jgi:hypothetical protein
MTTDISKILACRHFDSILTGALAKVMIWSTFCFTLRKTPLTRSTAVRHLPAAIYPLHHRLHRHLKSQRQIWWPSKLVYFTDSIFFEETLFKGCFGMDFRMVEIYQALRARFCNDG